MLKESIYDVALGAILVVSHPSLLLNNGLLIGEADLVRARVVPDVGASTVFLKFGFKTPYHRAQPGYVQVFTRNNRVQLRDLVCRS
jgi:hypothetical protein